MKLVFLGLSISSSWGNGHATTYRGLVRELAGLGHEVLFLERDVPWYRSNRDLPELPRGRLEYYSSIPDLIGRFGEALARADAVIQGSYVPEGVEVARSWLDLARGSRVFYDIDTPVTLAKLEAGDPEYLSPDLIPRFDLYLSFTGGPTLARLEEAFGAPRARAFYCSVDPLGYHPEKRPFRWDLGYLGTYSPDRQPVLQKLLMAPARKRPDRSFIVAGALYPDGIDWGLNVERVRHLPPQDHRSFYNEQRFTLNVTREDMVRAGYSPSVRLFEAAACGTPIISDSWPGLETFFAPGEEILIARSTEDVLSFLELPEARRARIGEAARRRVLGEHTALHRAIELTRMIHEVEVSRKRRLSAWRPVFLNP